MGVGASQIHLSPAGCQCCSERRDKTSLVPLLRLLSTTAIDYIQFLHKEKKKQEEEVSTLRKDVMALKIMKV